MVLNLPRHNIFLVNFADVFKNNVETKLLNDLYSYRLIQSDRVNIKHKDVKRLLYHHIIHELCVHVRDIPLSSGKIVVLYCTNKSPGESLHQFVSKDDTKMFFNQFIPKIVKMLPITFFCSCDSFDTIKSTLKQKNGNSSELIIQLQEEIEKFNASKYTFSKARYFARRYGLEYLSNNFFQQIRNKQLIFS